MSIDVTDTARNGNQNVKPATTFDNTFATKLSLIHNVKIVRKFKGSCMKQEKVGLNHRNIVHLFTVYELTHRKKLKSRFYPR